MIVYSHDIRQFFVDPKDARTFPIIRVVWSRSGDRVAGCCTTVEDIDALVKLHCDALAAKVALVKALLKP